MMNFYVRTQVLFCCFLLFLPIVGCSTPAHRTKQQTVHDMGHRVMPFELSKTLHIFRMTEFGGVQRVVTRDAAAEDQVALIRRHLQKEADAFRRGDYADPAALHGAEMPGLNELREGASKIQVLYSDLPNGGQILYRTSDLHLITAIHRWFGAQLSEHGPDARAE